jgi:DNA-binding transcriptional LysR family regulator
MSDAVDALIEPDLLQSFVAIAEAGSFTAAAGRVHRTQSAVSMQIKRLEDLVGRALFHRDGRAVRLTADGELLLGHARRILRAHREALASFAPSELRGTIAVGTPEEYAVAFLPAILARFAETHPLVQVDVICDTSINLARRLREREIAFALVTHGYGDDDGIVLHREPLVWAGSAAHVAHREDPVPLALFHPGCPFRGWAIAALEAAGKPYRLAYTSISLAGIEAALRAGLAVSAMPWSIVREGWRVLDACDGFPPLPSYQLALKRADDAVSPLHDRFEHHVIAHFRPARAASPAALSA